MQHLVKSSFPKLNLWIWYWHCKQLSPKTQSLNLTLPCSYIYVCVCLYVYMFTRTYTHVCIFNGHTHILSELKESRMVRHVAKFNHIATAQALVNCAAHARHWQMALAHVLALAGRVIRHRQMVICSGTGSWRQGEAHYVWGIWQTLRAETWWCLPQYKSNLPGKFVNKIL